MGVDLVRSLQPPDILLIHWRVYNSIANTSKRGLFLPSSDVCQKLSLSSLYFNKTLLHKSSERSSLVSGPGLNSSPPEAKDPGVFVWFNNNLSWLNGPHYKLYFHRPPGLSCLVMEREGKVPISSLFYSLKTTADLTSYIMAFCFACALNHVQLFVTSWIVTHKSPPSMGFLMQEYWGGKMD